MVKQKTPRGERSGLKLSEEVRARLEELRRREREVKDKISALEKRLERATSHYIKSYWM